MNPADVAAACWRELRAAVQQRGHGWRLMTLATVDGDAADARTVVLREVDEVHRLLTFYTDARSPKVAQIAAQPKGTLLAWSTELKWQLRLRVSLKATTQGPELASRWQSLQRTPAARDYTSVQAPGSTVSDSDKALGTSHHFALITAQVLAMDWLALDAQAGHQRLIVDAKGARAVQP